MPQAAAAAWTFIKGVGAAYAALSGPAQFLVEIGVNLALSAALTSIFGPDVPTPGGQINKKQALPPRAFGVGRCRVQGALLFIATKDNTLNRVIAWPENDGAPLGQGRTWLNDDLVTVRAAPFEGQPAGTVIPLADGRYSLKVAGFFDLGAVRISRKQGLLAETAYDGLSAIHPTWPPSARGDGIPTSLISCTHGKLENFGKQFPAREPELNEEKFYAAYDWRKDSTCVLVPANGDTPAVMGDGPQRRDDRSTWTHTRNNIVWGVNILWRVYGADWDLRFSKWLGDLTEEANACDETVNRVYATGTLTADALPGSEELELTTTQGLEPGSVLVAGDFELGVLAVVGETVTVDPLEAGFGAGTTFSWSVADAGGVGEPRYEVGFFFNKGTPPSQTLQIIVDSMAGWFGVKRDGSFVFRAGRDQDPTVIFGDEEISDLTFEPGPRPDEAINVLTVSYSDPDQAYAMVEGRQRRAEGDIAERGEERPGVFAPQGVQSGGQVGRMAEVALQRGLAGRGTFRTGLSGRRGLGERVIGIRCSETPDLYNAVVEISEAPKISLETASILWTYRIAPTFAWNPATQEGAPPTGTPVDPAIPSERPTITSVEVFYDEGGLPRLRVFATGPERADITWLLGIRSAGSSAFNEETVSDLDPDTPVKLESGIVPQGPLEVIAGYETGGGGRVWMNEADAVAIEAVAELIIYDGGGF